MTPKLIKFSKRGIKFCQFGIFPLKRKVAEILGKLSGISPGFVEGTAHEIILPRGFIARLIRYLQTGKKH